MYILGERGASGAVLLVVYMAINAKPLLPLGVNWLLVAGQFNQLRTALP
jgi:hypothetical protein